jgi:hypothetical protein
MTFSAGEITPGLVNGEVIFRPREVDSGDQPQEAVIRLFKRRFAGRRSPSFDFDETAPLGIALSD